MSDIAFNQPNQKVKTQVNTVINSASTSKKDLQELVFALEEIRSRVLEASISKVVDPVVSQEVTNQISTAIEKSMETPLEQSSILNHLAQANKLLKGFVEAGGIVVAIDKIINRFL
jgi:flagellar basal body-associated protein FliL